MTEPIIQGRCPGALTPMLSGDGLIVRVRPKGGRLIPQQAHGLATLALAHGNGSIDLSTRANIQIRGVRDDSYSALIDGLARLDLLDGTAEEEARRNMIVTPFWHDGDGVQDLAAALALALQAPNAPVLPSKFGFAVDCGAMPVLGGASADIRVELATDGELICRADGARTGARVKNEGVVDAAVDLARWFVDSGGIQGSRGRMRRHLEGGAELPERYLAAPAQATPPFRAQPGAVSAGVLVGFEFGQMSAQTLTALARHGALRATPWRMVLLEGAQCVPDIPELICDPANPMLRVFACSGSPACAQARQPTRKLARHLAPSLPPGAILHVSGCAKGCADPGFADITLTAQLDGFDGYCSGRVHRGLHPDRPADFQALFAGTADAP